PVAEASCPGCECLPGQVMGEQACDSGGHWAQMTATVGLYADFSALTIDGLDVQGFAENGVILTGTTTATWHNGSVSDSLGVGVQASGGMLELDSVTIERTSEGLRGVPSYALLVANNAVLTTTDVHLSDNDRYGLVLLDSI